MDDRLVVSSAADFAPKTRELPLPTGRVVTVKDVDLGALILTNKGEIPDFVSGFAMRKLGNKPTSEPEELVINEDNLGEFFKLVDVIVKAGVTSVRIVNENADYAKGEINLADMTIDEKLAIFKAVMPAGEAGQAISFRQGDKSPDVGLVRNGTSDGRKPQRRARAKK